MRSRSFTCAGVRNCASSMSRHATGEPVASSSARRCGEEQLEDVAVLPDQEVRRAGRRRAGTRSRGRPSRRRRASRAAPAARAPRSCTRPAAARCSCRCSSPRIGSTASPRSTGTRLRSLARSGRPSGSPGGSTLAYFSRTRRRYVFAVSNCTCISAATSLRRAAGGVEPQRRLLAEAEPGPLDRLGGAAAAGRQSRWIARPAVRPITSRETASTSPSGRDLPRNAAAPALHGAVPQVRGLEARQHDHLRAGGAAGAHPRLDRHRLAAAARR